MSAVAIWIDSKEAKIFKFTPSGTQTHHMKSHGHHPAESEGKNHPKAGGDADKFFHELAVHMSKDDSKEWLLLGPGLAKEHFKSHVESHHKGMFAKIVGMEGTDHLSDGQIQDHARKFFKHRGVFEGI